MALIYFDTFWYIWLLSCRKLWGFCFFLLKWSSNRNEAETSWIIRQESYFILSARTNSTFEYFPTMHISFLITTQWLKSVYCMFCFLCSDIQFQFPDLVLCEQNCKLGFLSLCARTSSVSNVTPRCPRPDSESDDALHERCILLLIFWIVFILLSMFFCEKAPGLHPSTFSFTSPSCFCSELFITAEGKAAY